VIVDDDDNRERNVLSPSGTMRGGYVLVTMTMTGRRVSYRLEMSPRWTMRDDGDDDDRETSVLSPRNVAEMDYE
jgi:hypothetical protein